MSRRIGVLLFSIWCGAAQSAEPVKVPQSVPFAEDAEIAGNIKHDCNINQQLGQFIVEYAKAKNVAAETVAATDKTMPGRVLVVEIRDAVSEGNPFLGHHKSTSVRGTLYQDGALVAKFKGRRNSMGGFGAGFKGSCSVLGRTVKALGEDIAAWLAAPGDDALLGDLK
jgi:hypothetical protein